MKSGLNHAEIMVLIAYGAIDSGVFLKLAALLTGKKIPAVFAIKVRQGKKGWLAITWRSRRRNVCQSRIEMRLDLRT